jgi:hypothetical protein
MRLAFTENGSSTWFLSGLTPGVAFPIIHSLVGAWLSLVERSVRDREVGGSNPLAPTSFLKHINNLERYGPTGLFFHVATLCPEMPARDV